MPLLVLTVVSTLVLAMSVTSSMHRDLARLRGFTSPDSDPEHAVAALRLDALRIEIVRQRQRALELAGEALVDPDLLVVARRRCFALAADHQIAAVHGDVELVGGDAGREHQDVE